MTRLARFAGLPAATILLLLPAALWAHGNMPPYIAFWGPFDQSTTHCQRMLGLAGQRCVDQVMMCDACGEGDLAQARESAIAASASEIMSSCDDARAAALGFRSLEEALSDLRRTCTDEPAAVSQLIAGAGGELATASCTRRLAAIGRMFARQATRIKRATLDSIATRSLLPSQRLERINRTARRLTKMRNRLDTLLAQACIEPPPATFLVLLGFRADCIVDGAYYQSAYQCPR